ncbi:uncharacterized protein [Heliangelus exortis]|uniref:uncharacterized protein n=1 Tax=Heliangelus exortis TaxID=472823 RepID=UPI003A8EF8D2
MTRVAEAPPEPGGRGRAVRGKPAAAARLVRPVPELPQDGSPARPSCHRTAESPFHPEKRPPRRLRACGGNSPTTHRERGAGPGPARHRQAKSRRAPPPPTARRQLPANRETSPLAPHPPGPARFRFRGHAARPHAGKGRGSPADRAPRGRRGRHPEHARGAGTRPRDRARVQAPPGGGAHAHWHALGSARGGSAPRQSAPEARGAGGKRRAGCAGAARGPTRVGCAPPRRRGAMELEAARRAVLAAVRGTCAADLPRLLHWMRNTSDFDELVVSNSDVVLKNIAEDLRNRLPIEAMFKSEHQAVQKIHQHPLPMIHVDAFLYDDDFVDSLCEEGKMSRSYCTECGSYKTASLEFISHSFSLMELKFLYQHVLPDLTGKVVVDVGSRLGAVLFAGYLYSSASQLYGVEMNADFCQLQEMMIAKYQFIDRIKVFHADICTQASLLQSADVVVMNNVFEYFLDRQEQARAWEFIACNIRKRGSLLVTVPSLQESLSKLQTDVQLDQWVQEMQLDYDVCMEKDVDKEALEQIHLYKIL